MLISEKATIIETLKILKYNLFIDKLYANIKKEEDRKELEEFLKE